ncbi:SURF1 family cytochrome oxidase biogenesis protein [Kineococcus sp. SYSU DK004]|uniref:SURF1 family cytochrome oxidase biogenesis protein n=1 Tax=Kineococcus sp. SYSU DK004 TaxID=3383125 RepID=UPI003D7EDBC4
MSTSTTSTTAPAAPRGVLALLREPRWVRGLVLAVVVAVACVVLGQWQWHRRAERTERNASLVGNYDRDPVAVDEVLPADGTPLTAADTWTPVRASGEYAAGSTALVRNRPREEAAGYEVLVPLVLDDGTVLVVDRGWLPAGSTSRAPDVVPAPPAGRVEVVARVRAWEEPSERAAPPGQVATIAAGPVAEQVGAAGAGGLRGGYALLASESPAPAGAAPLPPARPQVDEGPHLAYTVQWYGFALTALVVWVVAGRREQRARALTGAPAGPQRTGGDGAGPGERAAGRSGRRERRGVDEDAEDAEVERASRPVR